MDLPTCPACGQSVLEDDAVTCPFCGASMSATRSKPAEGPVAAAPQPPKPKPQVATTKPEQATPKAGSARPVAAKEKKAEEDLFDVAPSADVAQAIPMSPKPAKGRSHKVVCPMCETAGYVPHSAAGRNVKCANPDCMVPVFVAPKIQKAAVDQAAEEPPKKTGLWLAAGGVAVVVVGAGLYFLLRPPPKPETGAVITDAEIHKRASQSKDTEDVDSSETRPKTGTPPKPKALSLREIQTQALEAMVSASQQDQLNRSKPYCRRLTAEAYALAGNIEEARHQIERLDKVGSAVPYYQVIPWVAVAWKELEANRVDEANAAVEKAWSVAPQLPQVGRTTIDAATELAAALVAVGRLDDAVALIKQRQSDEMIGRESAAVQIAAMTGTFDLDTPTQDADLLGWESPQWVAVTVTLVSHGQWDAAVKWAQRAANLEIQQDCLTEWADALTQDLSRRNHLDQLSGRLEAASGQLGPAGRSRMLARAAHRELLLGNKSAAEAALDDAIRLFGEVPVPEPYRIGESLKAIYEAELPDAHRYGTSAWAAIEIARVQSQLGRGDDARKSITRGMAFVRAAAPSPPAIQPRVEQNDTNFAGVQKRLQTELSLASTDEARRTAIDYRKKVRQIAAAAAARMQLQISMYRVVAWGDLVEWTWNQIQSSEQAADINEREPFFSTVLPDVLIDRAKEDKDESLVEAITTKARPDKSSTSNASLLRRATLEQIDKGKWDEAAKLIQDVPQVDKSWKSLWAMRLACRLVKRGDVGTSMEFARAFRDPILKEDLFGTSAALATGLGSGEAVLTLSQEMKLTPTELVSAYRGVVAAAVASNAAQQPVAEAEADHAVR